jgi:hypothetical protein
MLTYKNTTLASIVLGGLLGFAGFGWAGGEMDMHDESPDGGPPFIGAVRDIDKGVGIKDARVTADIQNGKGTVITQTNTLGRFKFDGFRKEVDPGQIQISCSKDGYRVDKVVRRRPSLEPGAPIEIDCLMVRQ